MCRFRPLESTRAGDGTIPSGDDGNEPRAIAAESRDAKMQPFAAPKRADAWQSNQRDESKSESESTPISFTPLRRLQAAIVLGPVGPLELLGAEVSQRRVGPCPVVEALDVLEDLERRPLSALEGARVHALGLDDAP